MKKLVISIIAILTIISVNFVSVLSFEDEPEYEELYKYAAGGLITHFGSDDPVMIPVDYKYDKYEFRGVWVATVANIDMPKYKSEEGYKETYLRMLDVMVDNNLNAVVFQVRPTNDAFYPSTMNPWSRYLMGSEGESPGYDLLDWLIEETHKRGIEFHAWFNPYRVSTSAVSDKTQYLDSLDSKNFAKKYQHLVILDSNNKLILNPGEPYVKDFIEDTIMEVVENYDVDGIHFDDYFYPYSGLKAGEDNDEYLDYRVDENQSIDDWRRSNVDEIIENISTSIKSYNLETGSRVQFGISPFAIWRSSCNDPKGLNVACGALQSYGKQYADSLKWVKNNWLDYIVPQNYWEFAHTAAPYADVVDWWADAVKGTNVNLYMGQAIYRYESNINWSNYLELPNQLRYNKKYEEVGGTIYFSYKHFVNHAKTSLVKGRKMIKEDYYQYNAITPVLKNYAPSDIEAVSDIVIDKVDDNYVVKWNKVENAKAYVVYRTQENEVLDISVPNNVVSYIPNNEETIYTFTDPILDENNYKYYVTTLDNASYESEITAISTLDIIVPVFNETTTEETTEYITTTDVIDNNDTLKYLVPVIGLAIGLGVITIVLKKR